MSHCFGHFSMLLLKTGCLIKMVTCLIYDDYRINLKIIYSTVNWLFFHLVEFPAVLLNTSTGQIESEFQAYVQPQEHPILSEFCMELTGIKQVWCKSSNSEVSFKKKIKAIIPFGIRFI